MVEQVVVGIDVSKAKLDVALLPSGEQFTVSNDRHGRYARSLEPVPQDLEVSGVSKSAVSERFVTLRLYDQNRLRLTTSGPRCIPLKRIRAVESRQILTSVLRHHRRGGVSMAPTAYATAADDVNKSARLWTIV
jgi:hypothetical protein